MRIDQQANCFLCGIENIWLSTLVHEYQYCSWDVNDITHIYFEGALLPSGALPPLAPFLPLLKELGEELLRQSEDAGIPVKFGETIY